MFNRLTYFASFLALVVIVDAKKLPSFITPCKRNDPNLNQCWKDVVKQMLPHMKKGIPEMGIPPCDPLSIPRLDLEQPEGASIGFNAVLTNLTFEGGLKFTTNVVDVNLDKNYFYMEINFPELTMIGDYKANGRVLLINFEGDGQAHGKFNNVTLYATYNNRKITRKGKTHFEVAKKETKVTVGKIFVQFDDLFKNNQAITDNTNKLINENIEILYLEIQPIIQEVIGNLVTSVVENVNRLYSIDDLFPLK